MCKKLLTDGPPCQISAGEQAAIRLHTNLGCVSIIKSGALTQIVKKV